LNWCLLTAIATAAAFSDKQYPSAVLTLASTISTALVVVLSLNYGDRRFERFDIFCEIGAALGVILWVVFDNPLVAVIATVSIDFIAALPTLRHSWLKAEEETPITFLLASLGSLLAFAAIHKPHVLGIIYPVYLVAMNFLIFLVISTRRLNKS
jgi:hypothetical protein